MKECFSTKGETLNSIPSTANTLKRLHYLTSTVLTQLQYGTQDKHTDERNRMNSRNRCMCLQSINFQLNAKAIQCRKEHPMPDASGSHL
jgi:hypothetical protein